MVEEYISREAAIEALEQNWYPDTEFEAVIGEIPAADVRPVVLCKDCRHRDPEDHKCDCGGTERQGRPFRVHDNYFCAYGEK